MAKGIPGVPANFKGKKGRSGRKSTRDEALRNRVIERAWLMKDVKLSEQDATQIVLKDMAQKLANADGKNLPTPIYGGLSISEDNSNGQVISDEEENQGC